jgi:repressor LexA
MNTVHPDSMKAPTTRQQQILEFIQSTQAKSGTTPSRREIAEHFGFKSITAANDHINALCKKGLLKSTGLARTLQVVSSFEQLREPIVDIPLYGSIPAGFAEEKRQEADGCISIDIGTLGFKPTSNTFALRVRGDSMIERQIFNGDIVVVEHGQNPKNGDIVAALIDGESTLKTLIVRNGNPYLKAGNPRYPDLIPARELVIQGVAKYVLRNLSDE